MQLVLMSKVALLNVASVAKARQVESITPPNGLSYVEESIARCGRLTRQHIPFLRSSSFGAFINVSGNELESSIIKFANESSIAVVRTRCYFCFPFLAISIVSLQYLFPTPRTRSCYVAQHL